MAERDKYRAPGELTGLRSLALGVGGIGLVVMAVGAVFDVEQALRSWLLGFIFWAGIGIGGIGLLILQYLTGGAWGVVIRRTAEAASRTLPVIILLFLPIAFGVTQLYEWTHLPPTDHVIEARGWYMTVWGWTLRSAIYFAIFGVMAYLLNKWSANQDASKDHEEAAGWLGRATAFSGPTMVIFALTVTFAAVDWVMTLEPHWFSTIWGLLYIGGQGLSAFAFGICVLFLLAQTAPLNRVITTHHFHDLGKFLFAFLMLWAYLSFSQFLIIWSANIPEEIPHYLDRWDNSWKYLSIFIVVGHFIVPYALLLSRDLKKNAGKLRIIATWILFARVADYYWHVAPELHKGGLSISLLDVALPLLLGGVFISLFVSQLSGRSLLPVNDPALEKALHHHVH